MNHTIYWKVIVKEKDKSNDKIDPATILSNKGYQVVDQDNLIIKSEYPDTLNVLSKNCEWIYTILPTSSGIIIPEQNKIIKRSY